MHADVFLAFDKKDGEIADELYGVLTSAEHLVVFSATGPADDPSAKELVKASCVVVLWSLASVNSSWLISVAARARNRHALVGALIGDATPPEDFRHMRVHDLRGWTDDNQKPITHLVAEVRRLISSGQARAESTQRETRSGSEETPQARFGPAVRQGRSTLLFLCYRRDDTQDAAGRLYDRLTATFGVDRIFIDIDSLPLGIDFVDHVREQIARCSAVIVMIGRQWLTIQDKRGRRRLNDPDDLVRAEIAAALQQRVPVIPVIVQNAGIPSAEDLPDDIRLLARRNGIHLRPDHWKEGVERLLSELEPIMKEEDK
jgi:hypothetical protein